MSTSRASILPAAGLLLLTVGVAGAQDGPGWNLEGTWHLSVGYFVWEENGPCSVSVPTGALGGIDGPIDIERTGAAYSLHVNAPAEATVSGDRFTLVEETGGKTLRWTGTLTRQTEENGETTTTIHGIEDCGGEASLPFRFTRVEPADCAALVDPLSVSLGGIVEDRGGELDCSIRRFLGDRDAHWFRANASLTLPHRLLAINSLGRSTMAPLDVVGAILRDPSVVFPMKARGKDGQRIEVGNEFYLDPWDRLPDFAEFEVEVTSVGSYHWTFRALLLHPLTGTTAFGVFRDATGELWMFQQGVGRPLESGVMAEVNYHQAEALWREMAENARRNVLRGR